MPAVPDSIALTRAGNEALRKGDARTACEHFRRATSAGRGDTVAWLGLALACRALNDSAAALSAVERVLAREPHNFRGLIVRADLYSEGGDARSASSYYTAALRYAPAGSQMAPDTANDFRHAQQMSARYAAEYESYLRAQLAAAGYDPSISSDRFAQSLEMCLGKKQLYLQQPTQYYFPGLPQIQFYKRDAFPWLDEIEKRTDEILEELREIMKDDTLFQPYVEKVADRPHPDIDRLTDSRDWTAFYLWKSGAIVAKNAERFPRTLRALENVPHCAIAGRTPSILFSRLRPRAHIPPHTGLFNARLICHLPLIVPEGCALRVGNDIRTFEKGKAWVFDDTIEHEAWNNSAEARVILLFEIWRPELSVEEQQLVGALLKAVNAYGAG